MGIVLLFDSYLISSATSGCGTLMPKLLWLCWKVLVRQVWFRQVVHWFYVWWWNKSLPYYSLTTEMSKQGGGSRCRLGGSCSIEVFLSRGEFVWEWVTWTGYILLLYNIIYYKMIISTCFNPHSIACRYSMLDFKIKKEIEHHKMMLLNHRL